MRALPQQQHIRLYREPVGLGLSLVFIERVDSIRFLLTASLSTILACHVPRMFAHNALYWVGVAVVARLSFKFLGFVVYHLRPSRLPRYIHSEEVWAVVTGGAGGIGFGFSQELCRKGFNIVIIGHLQDELEEAEARLATNTATASAKVKLIKLDAAHADHRSIKSAVTEILNLNVTILINNVGNVGDIFKEQFKDLKRYSSEEIDSVMYINNRFLTYVTNIFLPTMIRNQPSTIINLSSGSSLGAPYQVIYGAAKAYNNNFSRSLDMELRAEGHKDLQVMSVVLGNVRSKGNVVDTSWAVPLANDIAKIILQKVGRGKSICVPYWRHAVQVWALESLLPRAMGERALIDVFLGLKKFYTERGLSVKEE